MRVQGTDACGIIEKNGTFREHVRCGVCQYRRHFGNSVHLKIKPRGRGGKFARMRFDLILRAVLAVTNVQNGFGRVGRSSRARGDHAKRPQKWSAALEQSGCYRLTRAYDYII